MTAVSIDALLYSVSGPEAGERLDIYLAVRHGTLSRSQMQKLIAAGNVTVNGQPARSNYRVRAGDCIRLTVPPPEPPAIVPEAIPLEILYEDALVIVINKPRGMVVHPACGNYRGTLVNALLEHCRDLSGIGGVMRPGIVHRLDKDTSGVMMAAKTDRAHAALAAQIKERRVTRKYIALVHGNISNDTGVIDAPIGRHPIERKKMAVNVARGKHAVTHFRVRERFGNYTLVEARLETGRTHQIRVHMAYIGHPVVGDPVYGPRKSPFSINGQALHAQVLGFIHPETGEYLEFAAPLPEDMAGIIDQLRKMRH